MTSQTQTLSCERALTKYCFTFASRFLVTLQQYPQLYQGRQCTIHVYNLDDDGNEVYKLEGFLKDRLFSIPNSTKIIVVKTAKASGKEAFDANLDDTLVIDITTNQTIGTRKINPTHLLHFSSDGKRAIDSTLRVFDIANGSVIQNFHTTLEDNDGVAKYRARITRDGKFAVWLKEQDGTLRIANIDSGELIEEAFTHALPQSLEVSEDNTIAIGCDDGRIMLLQIWPHDKPGREDILNKHVDLVDRIHLMHPQFHRTQKSACCTLL